MRRNIPINSIHNIAGDNLCGSAKYIGQSEAGAIPANNALS